MRMTGTQFTRKLWRQLALASSAALYLVLILTLTAFASNVSISDQAGVLNQAQVRKVASALRYPVAIYTVNGFSGSTQQFNQSAANSVINHPDMVVIAIDTNKRYLFITTGRDVPLTSSNATDARQAFASSFNGGNYTAATVGSLNSLQSSLNSQRTTSGGNGKSNSNGGGFGLGTCLIGLLVIGGLVFLVMRRRRTAGVARGGSFGGAGNVFNRQRPMNPNPNQPNQNPYPPDNGLNYGQGYNPGYPPQQQGINPLAAGGLGAAAGGLLGYGLGKSQGERDRQGESFGNSGDQSNSGIGAESGGSFGGNEDAGGGSGGFFGGNEESGGGSGGNF